MACLKMLLKNKLPTAAFPNKRQGTSSRGKASRPMGRGRAGNKTAGRRTRADRLPHGAHTVSVCPPFTLRISTLVSHWWILSSYKTLCYLHSLLIKKGKETPTALTTGGRKKRKQGKKEKERKKERKDRALWVAEIKWSENLMCKTERIKRNTNLWKWF